MSHSCVRLRSGFTPARAGSACVVPAGLVSAFRGRVLLDRYRLLEPMGMGGSGVVFAAEDGLNGERVAVKLLLPAPHLPLDVSRLRREAELACALVHPNLVGFRDLGQDGSGTYFIVMELLAGGTLAGLLEAHGTLDVPTTLSLLLPITEALAYVHEQGVLHRDIKPENLYLTTAPDGVTLIPKLIDFGIAKRTEQASITREGLMLGTPAYMSPEQAQAAPLTCASDVWSLGVVLFECLSGRLPFESASITALLLKLVNTDAPGLLTVAPEVPSAVAAIVDRALSRDPAGRPPTARALGRALTLAAGLDLVAEGLTSVSYSSRTDSRERAAGVPRTHALRS